VAEFDAELYLRLAGERALLDRRADEGLPWNRPLDAAGRALVAVGAMAADAAQAVVDDYDLAFSCREGEHHHPMTTRRVTRSPATARPGLGPLRAVPCGHTIEQPWGQLTISYVVLSAGATTLHVTMRPGPAGRTVGAGPAGHTVGPGLPGLLTLTDDKGTTAIAGFSGGGHDTEWSGQFEAHPPLATETAWIEILGERVELSGDPGAGVKVWVEPLAELDPARRYLWAKLASLAEFRASTAVEATIDTLVAAGSLDAADPVISEVRAVVQHSHGAGGPGGNHGPVPEPWRSLLAARGRGGGPVGLVVVGAATPQFDGMSAAVLAVQSAEDEFSVDVELATNVPHWHAFRGRVDEPVLAWWAADDRGHHYLGRQGSWHSSDDRSGGQIEFTPALDPAAARLDIMPTTTSARAVIRVPLAWAEER
jgi:hypothetical protein